MLSERVLIRTSLAVTLSGLLALYLILANVKLPVEELTVVGEERVDDVVRVEGVVTSLRHVGNDTVTLFTITEEVTRKAVVFDKVNLTKGARVVVEGTVDLYQGEPELVVERISRTGQE